MAITEFSSGPERRQVGFVGDMPAEAVEALKRRGYEPYQLQVSDLSQRFFLGRTCAVVLTQQAESPRGIYRELETFTTALNHDCRMYVRWAPNGLAKQILLRSLNKLELPTSGYNRKWESKFFFGNWIDKNLPFTYAPFVHVVDPNDSWDQFANTISHNEAGPAPYDSLKIEATDAAGKPKVFDDEADLLIRRAFYNCKRICLFGKGNGLSGVGAYEGYAYLREGELGGEWPYKFFVKLGERVTVEREFYKYGTTLLENVPFHLGPRLRRERCVLGATHGLIVSDFVLGAETICESAREGRGVPAIANLFNVTLLPWRRAADETPPPLSEYLLKNILGDEGKPRAVPAHRAERLQAFGAVAMIADLLQIVRDMPPSTPVLTGMVHGDLHATNVLVRGNDAVVIDLERVATDAPLLFDAANLEAGLFVDGFIKDPRSAKDIMASVASLYDVAAFEKDDHHCDPSDSSSWFMDSVRQIRMQAKQMERAKLQYAWMLGAVFIKKACNPDDFAADVEGAHFVTLDERPTHLKTAREAIRTLAYIVGERILLGLRAKKPTGAPT